MTITPIPLNHRPEVKDDFEAGSWRYSDKVLRVLPLSSGRLAVLTSLHVILAYVDTLAEAEEVNAQHCKERDEKLASGWRGSGTTQLKTEKTAEDLGL